MADALTPPARKWDTGPKCLAAVTGRAPRRHHRRASDSAGSTMETSIAIPPASTADFMGRRTRFSMLELVEEIAPRPLNRADGRRFVRRGRFACDCGQVAEIDLRNVRRGLTRSCGCSCGRRIGNEVPVREALRMPRLETK